MKNNLSVLRNKNYSRLLIASVTSGIGTEIGITAFILYLLKAFSEKPYLATMVELLTTLPMLFVFFLIGVVADRFDRQKIALYSDFICFVLSLLLLMGVYMESISFMFVVIFARKIFQFFFSPAQSGIVQGILSKEEYFVSSGLNQIIVSCTMLFGKGIGVTAYWLVGIEGAILLDAVSFLISYLLVRSCVIPEGVRLPNGKNQVKSIDFKFIFNDYMKGLKYIWNHSFLRYLVSGYFVFGILQAVLAIIPILYLKYKLSPHSYEQMTIIEGIVIGAGILLGSSFLTSISHKIKPIQIIIIGWVMTGVISASMGFVSSNQGFFILLFLCTFFVPFISMGIGGLLPFIVDPKFMGRVRGCIQPLGMLTTVLSFGLISVLFPKHISIESIFWFVGIVMLMTGLAYRMILPRFDDNKKNMEEVA